MVQAGLSLLKIGVSLTTLLVCSSGFQNACQRQFGISRKRCININSYESKPQISLHDFSLYSVLGSSKDSPNSPKRRFPNPLKYASKVVKKMNSARARFVARFQALSPKAKRIATINICVLIFMFGGITKAIVSSRGPPPSVEISYSSFLDLIEAQGKTDAPVTMDQVRIGTDRISYRLYRSPESTSDKLSLELPSLSTTSAQKLARQRHHYLSAYSRKVSASQELVDKLRENKVSFAAATAPRASSIGLVLRTAMVAFYFLILFRIYKTVSSAGGNSKSDVPGKLAQTSDLPRASFDEIQGIDDAKAEVMELVDALRNPDKYAILGARAPTGLLLVGPPGTGKTMLARATAATAGVPLIYCSGSDFVEMFVGRGAARVRKLFERADRLSPCIIFIDELDALGKSRDLGGPLAMSRSNDEAEQTLNQLLACMDGLDSSRRICVLAATNRKEVLDSALIRPGRFDRIVNLRLPDAAGREKILRVHTSRLPGFQEGSGIDPNRLGALGKGRLVDLSAIAAVTEGFSGAELEFLVNEAAIRAVRRVSAALQKGSHTNDIVPHVEATDFELSLRNFYETRKPKGGGVNEIFKNVWKQP